jgi:hypothetical protein
VYAARAAHNEPSAPLTRASTTLIKGSYELQYYFGYSELHAPELVRLYDVQKDPEEITDLSATEKDTTRALLDELKARIHLEIPLLQQVKVLLSVQLH